MLLRVRELICKERQELVGWGYEDAGQATCVSRIWGVAAARISQSCKKNMIKKSRSGSEMSCVVWSALFLKYFQR